MPNMYQQTLDPDEATGGGNLIKQVKDARSSMLSGGIQGIFDKLKNKADDASPDVPAVPVGRLVASPRRQLGKGTRDTILNGADGI